MRTAPHCWTRSGAAALILLLSLPAWAAADSWNRVQSRNFLVVGEVDHNQLAFTARTLEQFRRATLAIFPDRVIGSTRPLTVVVVKGGNIGDYGLGKSGNVSGYYQSEADQDFIVMDSSVIQIRSFEVILHEYQHSITRNNWRGLPRWVNEGLAEFYSTFQMSADGKRYQLGRPKTYRLAALVSGGTMPLEKFLTDDGRSVRMEERFRASIFYAQSWALVHFMVLGDKGKWSDSFGPFVTALAAGEPPVEAFRRTVTTDIAGFSSRFRAYVTQSDFNFVSVEASPIEAVPESERSRLSVEETETLKTRLMHDPGRRKKALDEALAARPGYRPALIARGEYWLGEREAARAAEDLVPLAQAGTADLRICSMAMFALNILRRHEEAIGLCVGNGPIDVGGAFERAIGLQFLGRPSEAAPLLLALNGADPGDLSTLAWRSWRYLEAGLYPAAVRAADLAAPAIVDADGASYQRFVRLAGLCLQRDPEVCERARADLVGRPIAAGAGEWVQSVRAFLTGTINEQALLARASRDEEQTEGHAYAAFDLLSRGRDKEALPHLQWVAERGSKNVTEYYVAVAHYARRTKP
ncbi:MAG TPA: DUF1570 domain-containing protein [Vicinamibacterales bacterium]|nr:DUF1570 domain-containing protein [Vicinamibacterales bacterium]